MDWPPKDIMTRNAKVTRTVYRADFSNHGSANILDLSIDLHVWFGDKGGIENAHIFTPVMSPVDAGARFSFYILNDCPVMTSVSIPDEICVRVAGESTKRTVHLNLPHRSPTDQVLLFFPSEKQWLGEQPCK